MLQHLLCYVPIAPLGTDIRGLMTGMAWQGNQEL